MEEWLTVQAVYLLRILIAALCGAMIGYERQNHMKNAGVRTHLIVAIASSLMMIVSKYGFGDILEQPGIELDPSRIAAGVVTAIGFLGAGIIFVHKQTVSGQTTAAGIWATVGIGMAVGAGMYLIGILTAAFITVLQMLFHKRRSMQKNPVMEKIVLRVPQDSSKVPEYIAMLQEKHIEILSTTMERKAGGSIEVKLYVRFPDSYTLTDTLKLLQEDMTVQSVEM